MVWRERTAGKGEFVEEMRFWTGQGLGSWLIVLVFLCTFSLGLHLIFAQGWQKGAKTLSKVLRAGANLDGIPRIPYM